MEDIKSLAKQVELAETQGSLKDLSDLITKLYKNNSNEALDLCIKLAMSDFDGNTYKMDYQNMSALGTLHWGPKGIVRLGQATIQTNSYRAVSNVPRFLSHISSKSLPDFFFWQFQI